VWREGEYTDRGKWMDGWESRRRRVPGHDFCIVRLGLPGVVHGALVDTSFFRGNYPEECAIDGTVAPATATYEDLCADSVRWVEIVPRSSLRGDSHNHFPVSSPYAFTHVRLAIYPDGGVARLRVHGEVVPDWRLVSARAIELDLVSVEMGGLALAASDEFFGSRHNLVQPGRGVDMGDGWETRRRRGPGHDWVVLRLGAAGDIRRVEVDTAHFKGNYPDTCALDACSAPNASIEQLTEPRWSVPPGTRAEGDGVAWEEILPQTKLQAHTRHVFVAGAGGAGAIASRGEGAAATHVRLRIYPDGGVSRLRVFGVVSDEGRESAGIARLNAMVDDDAVDELVRCCGSRRWAKRVVDARPFADERALALAAGRAFSGLERADWLEAFAAHPRIGDRDAMRARGAWSADEQSGARGASDELLDRFLEKNRAYEAKFGHLFIVCATGKSAADMMSALERRLEGDADGELRAAAAEQREITQLRFRKLLGR